MLNEYDSWHDSDEVDSDLEQEAYSLLYYNNDVEKESEVINNSSLNKNPKENIESSNLSASANLDQSILLSSSSSHSVIEIDSSSDSDSNGFKCIRKMTCSNPINALSVGISSDEDDFDDITRNTDRSSLIENNGLSKDSIGYSLNTDSDLESSINKENSSLFMNVISGTTPLKFTNNIQNTDDWSIDFQPLRSKYGNRYFDSGSKSVCMICSKKGHSEEECTRSGPICILCGEEGHLSKKCDNVVCCICLRDDHQPKSCPFTATFMRQTCKRCGQRGHGDEICPDIWRQYKFTTKTGRPVLKKCSSQNKSTVYCANCAKMGHFTEQCPRSRMNSRFLGPPPIMEIIKFEDHDIYPSKGLSYCVEPDILVSDEAELNKSGEELPSFIENMDVTTMVCDDVANSNQSNCSIDDVSLDSSSAEANSSQFGHRFIMLSPIKSTPSVELNKSKSTLPKQKRSMIESSTPRNNPAATRHVAIFDPLKPKVPTKLPGITTDLLKKLFPEETQNYDKLPPGLRKKLRKQLKNLIDHGYLPGDSNLTQERMEFWLQEISTGRNLSYRDKKRLLGSVSAALHSISDRVSINDVIDLTNKDEMDFQTQSLSVPESRKKRNKFTRQEKNLKNIAKVSRKEKKDVRKMEKAIENSIKDRLRANRSVDNKENRSAAKKNKFRKNQRKSEIIQLF